MENSQKIIIGLLVFVALVCGVVFLYPFLQNAQSSPTTMSGVTVYFFYGEECSHCHKVMPFIQSLQKKYPDVDFQLLETWHNKTNNNLSVSLNQKLGIQKWGVPEVVVGNVSLMGDIDIPDKLESVILDQKKKP
jgi:thiol-disulfide isomerase/thioredoxin